MSGKGPGVGWAENGSAEPFCIGPVRFSRTAHPAENP
ncbi:MAG: hypothetical protein QOD72_994 [Acidimicrobiaceae bacterium]|jgi:hypothetical protein|nr:hypothetical protein [Acidimicrobiaceae bacterium]